MIPAKCDYVRASSAQEAVELLGQHAGARLLAGGHSLIPMMKLRLAEPAVLIDIGRIAELRGIESGNGEISIGALTTHAELAASEVLQSDCAVLAEAAARVGDPQVRNKGTLGGNIAHADPASDLPAVLVALGATVHLLGSGGERQVAAAEFFVGLLSTDARPDEIITAVSVPPLAAGSGSCYLKVEHPASGYAVCGAAAVVAMADGKCASASLCFNGIAATPWRADVADALPGGACDDAAIEAAMESLSVGDPLGDLHASGEYRVALARTYGKRALKLARERAGGRR